MIYIGIDPGASGAIAVLTDANWWDFCRLSETPHDVAQWLQAQTFDQYGESTAPMAMLERVSAMPKQGVSSTFKFGTSYGFCLGLLTALQIPFEQVTPGKWQRAMGCLSKGDKNVTKRKAQELFSASSDGRKITHANADSLLIAEYCRRTRNDQS